MHYLQIVIAWKQQLALLLIGWWECQAARASAVIGAGELRAALLVPKQEEDSGQPASVHIPHISPLPGLLNTNPRKNTTSPSTSSWIVSLTVSMVLVFFLENSTWNDRRFFFFRELHATLLGTDWFALRWNTVSRADLAACCSYCAFLDAIDESGIWFKACIFGHGRVCSCTDELCCTEEHRGCYFISPPDGGWRQENCVSARRSKHVVLPRAGTSTFAFKDCFDVN